MDIRTVSQDNQGPDFTGDTQLCPLFALCSLLDLDDHRPTQPRAPCASNNNLKFLISLLFLLLDYHPRTPQIPGRASDFPFAARFLIRPLRRQTLNETSHGSCNLLFGRSHPSGKPVLPMSNSYRLPLIYSPPLSSLSWESLLVVFLALDMPSISPMVRRILVIPPAQCANPDCPSVGLSRGT